MAAVSMSRAATQVLVFDLDTLKSVGAIPNARARGVAVDPEVQPRLLQQQPGRDVGHQDPRRPSRPSRCKAGPDGILFEPLTERIYVFSHSAAQRHGH